MKSLLIVVLFALILAIGEAGEIDIGASPQDYLKISRGSRSVARDDAKAYVQCPEDYTLLQCECETFGDDPDGCDGAMIINDAEGDKCSASNSATGKGVVAKATCGVVAITVTTEYKDMPKLKCPPRYRLISCAMLTPFGHQYAQQKRPPMVKKDGGLCKTSKGCDNCKLTARCIRQTFFYG